ncbi:hypothetical protein EK21DRAFT_90163 [Setomelanomma holmii]|uniref:Secreted protein n=1 Tax=Setomelanomma holmii TaxID=210430 RepID=A0A9P4H7G5_9PLEO|nr:hypothetical protein EK21DRAFT_90163 [Setomelanomma holmii]
MKSSLAFVTLLSLLFNGRNSTCEATLRFSNPSYLPLSWTVQPLNCAGDQTATFKVPVESPNGTVVLEWQCAGHRTTSSTLLNITGGLGEWEQLNLERDRIAPVVTCQNSSSLMRAFLPNSSPGTTIVVPDPASICT